MFVKVVYYKPELDLTGTGSAFGGREYTYRSELPLKTGDKVVAPTYKGDQKAMVVAINVPEQEIDPAWADRIRSIDRYWTQEDGNG